MKGIWQFMSFLTLIIFCCCACSQPSNAKRHFNSVEVIKGDTVNLTNEMGKQGKWIPTRDNKLKDTVFYRNDTLIN